jgi:predicted deacylase
MAGGCAQRAAAPSPAARQAEPRIDRPSRPVVEPAVGRPAPVRRTLLGRSVNGAPLVLQLFGDGPETMFVFGGIHGSEPTSASLAGALAEYMRTHPQAAAGRTIGILAEANPDGLARGRRGNANGVDLNRNFPASNWRRGKPGARYYGGPEPASEPETRAIMQAVEMLNPQLIISIHSINRGRHCNNYDGPGESLANLMAGLNGYPAAASMGYPTPGSFGSWAGVDRDIPTITLELPRDLSARQCWHANRAALLAAVCAPDSDRAK